MIDPFPDCAPGRRLAAWSACHCRVRRAATSLAGVRARASPGNYSARGSRPSAHEQVPDAVHARDVAGSVGMSSGHVLHHFGKRERILIETLLLSEEDLAQDRGARPGRFCAPWSAMVRFIDFYLHREPGDAGWSLNSDVRPAATGLRRPRAPCRSVLAGKPTSPRRCAAASTPGACSASSRTTSELEPGSGGSDWLYSLGGADVPRTRGLRGLVGSSRVLIRWLGRPRRPIRTVTGVTGTASTKRRPARR